MCDANNYITFFTADDLQSTIIYQEVVISSENLYSNYHNKLKKEVRAAEKREAFEKIDPEEFDRVIREFANEEDIDPELSIYASQFRFVMELSDSALE
jgi:HJR/Mrr/RecB family endonuclease